MRKILLFLILFVEIVAYKPKRYKEPATIEKFFPDEKPIVATPSTYKNRKEFTTQKEMLDYLGNIHVQNKHTVVNLLGPTKRKHYIPVFLISKNGSLTFKKTNNGKLTVMLIGQQHGDEPMSGDVLLGTIKRIAMGDLNYLLKKINIIVMPRTNPDGAEKFTRTVRRDIDMNDDHQRLYTVEATSVNMIYEKFKPEVFIDIHEYIADKKSYSKILKDGALPYYDLLILNTSNPNYSPVLRKYTRNELLNMKSKLGKVGYRTDFYYNPFIKPKNNNPLTLYRATSNEKLARNAFGLKGSLAYLIELRGRGIGFENVTRRLNSGLVAAQYFLERVYLNSKYIKDLVARERKKKHGIDKDVQIVAERMSFPLLNIKKGVVEQTPAKVIKQKNN